RREIAAALPERVRHAPEIGSLVVIDAEGLVRYSSRPVGRRGGDLSRAAYFKMARSSDEIRLAVADPLGAGAGSRRAVYLSRRFTKADGGFGGVIAATLNPEYVERFFSTLNIGEHGLIAVATTDGTMLVERPAKDEDVGRDSSASMLFREMLPWASS